MLRRALLRGCPVWLPCALVTSAAFAQDTAAAGALFEKGVADMEAGKFASGCPAIEESQRLDPRPGTLFTLAECNAGWGKIASAAAQYQEYLDLVPRLTREQQQRHQARVDIARSQLGKLKPRVPTLTLVLPPTAPSGTYVTRNGDALKGAALGIPLPVDPGSYVIVTHVPGAAGRETRVSLEVGDAKRLELDVAPPSPAAPPVAVSPPPTAPRKSTPLAEPSPSSEGRSGKTASLVAFGAGLTGVVVGSVSGALVFGKKHDVTGNCTGKVCNATGLAAAEDAKSLAMVSNIGFGVGLAGIALGTILWVSGASSPTSAPQGKRTQPLLLAGENGVVVGVSRAW